MLAQPLTVARAAWLAAVLALALPQVAGAGFSSQLVPISDPAPNDNTVVTHVAMNAAGGALVVWTEGGLTERILKARRLEPDGSLGPVLTISDGTFRAGGARVAFAPNGRAFVAWPELLSSSDPAFLRGRWVEPNDELGPQLTLRNAGMNASSGEISVAATATNDAFVAWHNFNDSVFRRVEARYVAAEGMLGSLLFPTSGAGSTGVKAAPDSTGGVLIAWKEGTAILAQSIADNGALGTLQTPGVDASAQASLATDGADHFQLLYRKGAGPSSLEYRALAPDATFGGEQTLDPAGPTLPGSYDLATNSGNRSLVTWFRSDGTTEVVKARFIGSDGAPETDTFSVADASGNQRSPDAGIGGGGAGAIAWILMPPTGSSSLWGRIIPPAGPPPDPVRLSSPTGEPSFPLVEMAPNDVGVSAWHERLDPDNPDSQAQIFARQILPAPACPTASGTIEQGRPTRIELECTGLQLQAPEIVEPPAHGTLDAPEAVSQSVVYTPEPGYDGPDSFTFRGVNRGGVGATQTAALSVGRDTIAPVIERLGISRRRVRLADASASQRRKRRKQRATTLSLRYSEPATARIKIERRRKCPRRSKRRAKRCKKFKQFASLNATPAAISAKVTFKRRIGKRKLRPGRYRVSAVAEDLAGNRSKVKRLRFKVTRRRR